jgi:para-nitrobenzyl esterase
MESVVVQTDRGPVSGRRERDLDVFRGVPYAQPPVGPLRFRAPQLAESWTTAREAFEFEPNSVQPPAEMSFSIPGDPMTQSEDCLYLNIWTPGCDRERRPVMVWIHGGGFVGGSPSSALYSGHRLAGDGVVLVSVAYRLGALGWLADPCLREPGRDGYGNWGLHDQIAALEWVQRNIAAFGGDPGSVTVFGESAGAMSVVALMATSAPQRGLFRRAIVESGNAAALSRGSASRVAEEMAVELELDALSREALEALPAEELLAAQVTVGTRLQALGLAFQPVVDGGLLSDHPAALIEGGSAAGVRVLIGTNRDEWRFWTLSNPELAGMEDERLVSLVSRSIDNAGLTGRLDPRESVELYRAERSGRGEATAPVDIYTAFSTDWVFRVPSMRLAGSAGASFDAVYAYLFDWESPLGGGFLGSCHALELPFVFGSLENSSVALFAGDGEEAERLSAAMRRAWTTFAATGVPAGSPRGTRSGEAAEPWPAYETTRRFTQRFGRVIEVVEAPMERERALLDGAWGPFGTHERAVAERAVAERADLTNSEGWTSDP